MDFIFPLLYYEYLIAMGPALSYIRAQNQRAVLEKTASTKQCKGVVASRVGICDKESGLQ